MKQLFSLKILPFLLLIFFAVSFTLRSDDSFDQDLGRHIRLGEIIVSDGLVPKINLFSYTNPDFPFINHHFAFEIFTFLGQKTLGIEALLWIKIAILLTTVGITLSLIKKAPLFLSLSLSYIFIHLLRERTELRPEIFSYLFTALTYFVLTKFEEGKTRLIWFLPVIQLLWVNTHIYFPVGLILQVIFLAQLALKNIHSHPSGGKLKFLGSIFGLSVAVSLINPNGFIGLTYPLNVFGNYGYTIAENQNMFLLEKLNFRDPNFLFVKLSWVIIIISLLYIAAKRKISLKCLLLCMTGFILSLAHIRSLPYLFFISLPAVVGNFAEIKSPRWSLPLILITSAIIITESVFYLSGSYYKYADRDYTLEVTTKEHGKNSLDFVLANNLPQPIFNNFDIGSYIIYRGYPSIKVFVDGRPEAYPKEFFKEIYIPMQENPQIFQKADEKYGFKTIIFSHTDQTPWGQSFLRSVIKDSKWSTIYLDNFMIVLVKKNEAISRDLKEINLSSLDPESYNFPSHANYLRLSIFLSNIGEVTGGEKFAKKSLELFPESPAGNLILASVYGRSGDLFKTSAAESYYKKSQTFIFW